MMENKASKMSRIAGAIFGAAIGDVFGSMISSINEYNNTELYGEWPIKHFKRPHGKNAFLVKGQYSWPFQVMKMFIRSIIGVGDNWNSGYTDLDVASAVMGGFSIRYEKHTKEDSFLGTDSTYVMLGSKMLDSGEDIPSFEFYHTAMDSFLPKIMLTSLIFAPPYMNAIRMLKSKISYMFNIPEGRDKRELYMIPDYMIGESVMHLFSISSKISRILSDISEIEEKAENFYDAMVNFTSSGVYYHYGNDSNCFGCMLGARLGWRFGVNSTEFFAHQLEEFAEIDRMIDNLLTFWRDHV